MELVETRRQAEIGQLDVTTPVKEDVVGFDVTVSWLGRVQSKGSSTMSGCVPVDKAQLVDGFNGQDNLGNVESRDVLGKDFILNEHRHQVSSGQELHEHIEEVRILEGRVQFDDPGTVRLGQNVTFGSNVSKLVLFEHLGLYQRLHSVDRAISLLLYQLDLTKGTLSDNLDGVVVLGLVLCSQETKILALFPSGGRP